MIRIERATRFIESPPFLLVVCVIGTGGVIGVLAFAVFELSEGRLPNGPLSIFGLFWLWGAVSSFRSLKNWRPPTHPRNEELGAILTLGMKFVEADQRIRTRYHLLATPRHFRAGVSGKMVEYEVKGAIFLVKVEGDRVTGWSAK